MIIILSSLHSIDAADVNNVNIVSDIILTDKNWRKTFLHSYIRKLFNKFYHKNILKLAYDRVKNIFGVQRIHTNNSIK